MSEHAPVILKKMLSLRRFPILDGVPLREVARVAESVHAVMYPAGTIVGSPDVAIDAVHLVLDGQLAMRGPDHAWGPAHAFGLVEVLSGRSPVSPVVATCDTRVFLLPSYLVEDILEDNFGILAMMLRRFAGRLALDHVHHRLLELPPAMRHPLGLVERLIVLRQLVPFTRARLRALASIAHGAREQTWRPGQPIVRAGERPAELHVVLEGTLRTAHATLEPGDSFGTFEALAAQSHELAVEAVTAARTLTCSGTAILDVIEDHTDLGISILRTCARALLDRPAAAVN